MTRKIRCPKCERRLFDVIEKTIGPVTSKCKCKDKVLVMFYSLNNIIYK